MEDEDWTFAIFDKPPQTDLTSVAWQIAYVPRQQSGGISQATIRWTLDYGVALCNFDQGSKIYSSLETVPAYPGNAYQVITNPDGNPYIPGKPTGTAGERLIILKNNTNKTYNLGFTIANNVLVVKAGADGNVSADFEVHPTYFVSCFRELQEGQTISSDLEIPPVKLVYDDSHRPAGSNRSDFLKTAVIKKIDGRAILTIN